MAERVEEEVASILKQHRAVLTRTKRHNVWKFPSGQIFTTAQTPSDFRAANNQLRDLKRILGLNGVRGVPGERREDKRKPGAHRAYRVTRSLDGTLQEKLRLGGLVEDSLRVKIATLVIELRESRRANHRKKAQLRSYDKHCSTCWGCRIARLLKRIAGKLLAIRGKR